MSKNIPGVIIKKLNKFSDARGWLLECFRQDQMDKEIYPLMSYISMSHPETVRGPHEHLYQTDYFCFFGSSAFKLYLWDNRKGSSFYGQRLMHIIKENEPQVIIIPPRIVHAYKNIGSNPGFVINCPNKLYAGPGKKEKVDEVRYEDDQTSLFNLD